MAYMRHELRSHRGCIAQTPNACGTLKSNEKYEKCWKQVYDFRFGRSETSGKYDPDAGRTNA